MFMNFKIKISLLLNKLKNKDLVNVFFLISASHVPLYSCPPTLGQKIFKSVRVTSIYESKPLSAVVSVISAMCAYHSNVIVSNENILDLLIAGSKLDIAFYEQNLTPIQYLTAWVTAYFNLQHLNSIRYPGIILFLLNIRVGDFISPYILCA